MAGGIFHNYPFVLNPKCVVFSVIIIGLFFYCPPAMDMRWKLLMAFFLFVVSYVAMAWYDYKFECQKLALRRGTSKYSITQQLKPPTHTKSQTDQGKETKDETILNANIIHIYHIFFIAPLLLYIGLKKQIASSYAYLFLIVNLSFAILYHLPRFIRNYNYISLAHLLMGVTGIYYSLIKTRPELFYTSMPIFSAYVALKHGFKLMAASHLF
jgi:hypothetical protein